METISYQTFHSIKKRQLGNNIYNKKLCPDNNNERLKYTVIAIFGCEKDTDRLERVGNY